VHELLVLNMNSARRRRPRPRILEAEPAPEYALLCRLARRTDICGRRPRGPRSRKVGRSRPKGVGMRGVVRRDVLHLAVPNSRPGGIRWVASASARRWVLKQCAIGAASPPTIINLPDDFDISTE